MEKAIKGYSKGIQKDVAKSKYDPNAYFHGSNIRIVTNDGSSTGSIENEKGTRLSFKIPNIPTLNLLNGVVIPQQNNLKIIGLGALLDTIIVITTNENSESPASSYGQIWTCKYDEATDQIIGLDSNGYLVPATHLKYNNILNLSTFHTIKKIIGRYENANTQRIYFTDNYNSVRVFNIADPNSLTVDPGLLDMATDTLLSQPVPIDIGTGSLPAGTMIQFSYRLLSEGGAESLYAPCSVLYPLAKTDIHTGDYKSFQGDGASGTDFTKSVTYVIKDIDTRFKYIEHIAIIYTRPDIYTIYKFDEQTINPTGETTVTCTDVTDAPIINPIDFNILSSGFKIAKDLEVKNRRLIAANTKTTSFDINFDARAYRFNSSQDAKLYLNNGTLLTLVGPNPDYASVPEDHDCINLYNDEQGVNWATEQNLYQVDGTTIGGSGLNVSYSFVTHEMPSNFLGTGITKAPPHVEVSKWSISNGPETLGVTNIDGSSQYIVKADQFKNNASAYNPAFYRGYARGETYRFGIVFYDKKGSPSFVKWIGDIKFPEPTDGFPIQDYIGLVPYLYSLGIQFNVDITSIRDQISAFEIVRVKREEDDKTRLGSGGLMFFAGFGPIGSMLDVWNIANGFGPSYPADTITTDTNIYNVYSGTYCLYDRLGMPPAGGVESYRLTWLLSPIGQLKEFTHKNKDYTKTTGYYRSKGTRYHASAPPEATKTFGFYYKALDFVSLPHAREWYQINGARTLEVGEFVPEATDIIPNPYTYTGVDDIPIRNSGFGLQTARSILGLGSKKVAMIYSRAADITLTTNDGDPAGNWLWNAGTGYYSANTFTGDEEDQDSWFKEVLYCRQVVGQYGGNTYVDRSLNTYMSCGHYQIVNDNTFTVKVYGGDVFVNYFDDEYITWYNNREDAYLDPYDDPIPPKLSMAACMPCETDINFNYRLGKRWASHRDATNMTSFNIADFMYNLTYSQQNNTELKFYAKDAIRQFTEEQPHRLWASDNKIDGELVDSWRKFATNNYTEVNGIHGPINKLVNFRDKIFFYQDKAFGVASIDDQAVITDESGQTLVLGTGGIFPNYGYVSVNTGSVHQLGVSATESGIYHFDARLKKFFKYNEGASPLSDIKGLSSWFDNEIQGSIRNTDLLTIDNPMGVVSTPDYRYNRVLFTFLNHKPIKELPRDGEKINYFVGDVIFYNGEYYEFNKNQSLIAPITFSELFVTLLPNYIHGFTISYNEITDSFESFYDYKPSLYLNNGRRLISLNPFNNNSVYEHNEGVFGYYYDKDYYKSSINLLLADKGLVNKILTNISYILEVYDDTKSDVYNDNFDRIRTYNEYQDTGIITLDSTNSKKRMRNWHYTIPRDINNKLSRMRNPWFNLVLEYDNQNNKRFVLNDLVYDYIISQY
jgi:hypothetical protein